MYQDILHLNFLNQRRKMNLILKNNKILKAELLRVTFQRHANKEHNYILICSLASNL